MRLFTAKKKSSKAILAAVSLQEAPIVLADIVNWYSQQDESLLKTITNGDLHASVKRLLVQWAHPGIVEINGETYCDVDRILSSHDEHITKLSEDFHRAQSVRLKNNFNTLVSHLEPKMNDAIYFRSIGDNLADRGANDYFILKLYSLKKNKKILYSNHDSFFMDQYEFGFFDWNLEDIRAWIENFERNKPIANQYNSFVNLAKWIVEGIVTPQEIKDLVEGTKEIPGYKSALKLLDYDVDIKNNHISIYSHAPIDFELIESMANYFRVEYRDKTIIDLCQTIDSINEKFQEKVKNDELNKINNINSRFDEKFIYDSSPVYSAIWSRPTEVVYDEKKVNRREEGGNSTREKLFLPKNKNYSFTFTHGHMGEGMAVQKTNFLGEKKDDEHYVNTDTDVGKCWWDECAQIRRPCDKGRIRHYLATTTSSMRPSLTDRSSLLKRVQIGDESERSDLGCSCLFFGSPTTKSPGVENLSVQNNHP